MARRLSRVFPLATNILECGTTLYLHVQVNTNLNKLESSKYFFFYFVTIMIIYCIFFSLVITCPALLAPANGTRLLCPENTTVYYDTVCQFSCNNGFIGSGSQVRRCQHDGTWSGQEFLCQSTLKPSDG